MSPEKADSIASRLVNLIVSIAGPQGRRAAIASLRAADPKLAELVQQKLQMMRQQAAA